jgi:hypothetical protein
MKKHKLPVKPYLVKYLQKNMVDGVYRFHRRVTRVERNSMKVMDYFERNRNSPHFIWVEMREASLYTLYGIQSDLAEEFRSCLFTVMAFAVKSGMGATAAARAFLESYNITDDDYDISSAYRTWQRRKEEYLNPTIPVLKTKKQPEASLPHGSNQLSLF